ncbi:ACP S-malonyltransferase [Betaproteobacteria bacterium]|nr:ACP S-malonyltransferase [Betaproteobacteria bacterium]
MGFDVNGSMKGHIAFVFPGQGSQSIGMMDSFRKLPVVNEVIEESSDALNENLFKLIDNGPEGKLNLTTNTQPIMLTCSLAIWKLFLSNCRSCVPGYFAGHSLGEYSALTAANAFKLTEAVELVRYRADIMQSITPPGDCGMVAVIGLNLELIQSICKEVNGKFLSNGAEQDFPQIVEVANINSDKQIVLSGAKGALEAMIEKINKLGGNVRIIELPVSAPFHSSILKPIESLLAKKLELLDVQKPRIPTLGNYHAEVYGSVEEIRRVLPKQAHSVVKWKTSIDRMLQMGVSIFVECGPGKVLSGLVRQINRRVKILSLRDYNSFSETVEYLEKETEMETK